MIIWLASYPRSGNTFFRMLLNFKYGIKTYSIYDDSLFDRLEGISEVVGHEKLPMSLKEMIGLHEIYFVKTHNLPSDDLPAIYLVRDGRDVLVSFSRYLQSFKKNGSLWKRAKESLGLSGYSSMLKDLIVFDKRYGGWDQHVLRWRHRKGQTFTLKYEDLVQDPLEWVGKMLEATGYASHTDINTIMNIDVPSFEELHAKWPQFFCKGRSGSWREEMTSDLHELFWKYHGDAMKELGYER